MLRTETQEVCYNTLTRNKSHTENSTQRFGLQIQTLEKPTKGKTSERGEAFIIQRNERYLQQSSSVINTHTYLVSRA
jgi:hypothetical protein